MTSTVEIIKVLLKDVLALEVLRVLNTEELTPEELFNVMKSHPLVKIEKAVKYLDSVGLIVHVFRIISGSLYRISAVGARVLEITEEAIIEEAHQ